MPTEHRRRADDAACDFETETSTERLLFKLLDERIDGAAEVDPEVLRRAGVKITEAAEQLLAVLLPDEGASQ